MFMHMPKKLGIPVMIAVAAAVGAYYLWVLRPVVVDDWTVYQGSARRVVPQAGEPCVDILYIVRRPTKPLFRYSLPSVMPRPENVTAYCGPFELTFSYLSERTTAFRIIRLDRSGGTWEARATVERSSDWKTVTLGKAVFKKISEEGGMQDRSLDAAFDFYDDSDPAVSSPRFSNRISFRIVDIRPYEPER